jgi:hypothetical protein
MGEEKNRHKTSMMMRNLEIVDEPPITIPKPIKKELTEEDFDTGKKIREKVGDELMDLDKLAKDIFGVMPSTSSEMMYRMQLATNIKVYGVFMAIGLLMVVAVFLYL